MLIGSRYGKDYFLKAAKQTTGIASINMKQLKSLPVYIPPTALQSQFAALVERMDNVKLQKQASLTGLQALYQSLLHAAFQGELDVSKLKIKKKDARLRSRKNRNKILKFRSTLQLKKNRQLHRKAQDHSLQWPSKPVETRVGFPVHKIPKDTTIILSADSIKQSLDSLRNRNDVSNSCPTLAQLFTASNARRSFAELQKAFPSASYNYLHGLVFQALREGQLRQYFDETTSELQLQLTSA